MEILIGAVVVALEWTCWSQYTSFNDAARRVAKSLAQTRWIAATSPVSASMIIVEPVMILLLGPGAGAWAATRRWPQFGHRCRGMCGTIAPHDWMRPDHRSPWPSA